MLKIPLDEIKISDLDVFQAFDLGYPGLEKMHAALKKNAVDEAKKELEHYFHIRRNIRYLFDCRGRPLKKLEVDDYPNAFQASLGIEGSLKAFCLDAAEKMMRHIYVKPGGSHIQTDLGADFENLPQFNGYSDEGKKNRTNHNIFVRGPAFEYLAVLYQETGEPAVLENFVRFFHRFFEENLLQVEDASPSAGLFQKSRDRTVMSTGWLAMVLTNLLYTELAYAQEGIAFEIIKHIWFIGIQFRRFDSDSYHPYNHHLFERGLMPFMLGVIFPEIPAFAAMKEQGAAVVNRHVNEDFTESGGYSEHSTAYWAGAVLGEMLGKGLTLARLNNQALLSDEAFAKVEASFRALAAIAPPRGQFFSIGDVGAPSVDAVMRLGARSTDSPFCRFRLSNFTEAPPNPGLPLYYCDPDVGYIAGRDSFSPQASYCVMSAKRAGGYIGHDHMDQLSLCVCIRGEAIFSEPYVRAHAEKMRMGSEQRGFIYNMESHNTVLVHGKPVMPSACYAGGWGLCRPDTVVEEFTPTANGVCFSCYHSAYTFCRHTRKVAFVHGKGFLVGDQVHRGNRQPEAHIQRWFLDCGAALTSLSECAVLIEKNGTKTLCMWKGALHLRVWYCDLFYPEIIADRKELYPVLDISFGGAGDADGSNASRVEMAILDMTLRPLADVQGIARALEAGDDSFTCSGLFAKLESL